LNITNSIKLKISLYLLYILAAVSIGFGSLYFFRNNIMPYHYSFLHTNFEELNAFNPNIIKLMTAFMKIIGSSFIGIGLGILILTYKGIRLRKSSSWWTILLIFTPASVVTYIITLIVSSNITTGPKPPSWLALLMIIMLVLSLLLSSEILRKEK